MPNSLVKSFADKANKTIAEVEDLWKNAVNIVKKEYNIKETNKRFYPLVVGVLKKSLGFTEALTFKSWLNELKLLESVSDDKKFNKTIALVAGSFKPPHFAHLYMVLEYVKQADKVIIIISDPKSKNAMRKTKLGTIITPEMSKQIWEIYLKKYGIANKVDVIISPSPSPIGSMFEYIDSGAVDNCNIILGVSKKGDDLSRFKSVEKAYSDKDNVHILTPDKYAVNPFKSNGKEVSATDIRNNIDNFQKVKELLPEKLSDNDIQDIMKILGVKE